MLDHADERGDKPRFPFEGSVRLLIPMGPWRLLLTLRGGEVSAHDVVAHLESRDFADGDRGELYQDLGSVLAEGDPYELQLEPENDTLPSPRLAVRLGRRQPTARGLELTFFFEEAGEDFTEILQDLAPREVDSSRRQSRESRRS